MAKKNASIIIAQLCLKLEQVVGFKQPCNDDPTKWHRNIKANFWFEYPLRGADNNIWQKVHWKLVLYPISVLIDYNTNDVFFFKYIKFSNRNAKKILQRAEYLPFGVFVLNILLCRICPSHVQTNITPNKRRIKKSSWLAKHFSIRHRKAVGNVVYDGYDTLVSSVGVYIYIYIEQIFAVTTLWM